MDYNNHITATEPSFNNNSKFTLNNTKLSKFNIVTSTEESIIKKSNQTNNFGNSRISYHKHTQSQPEIKILSNCTNTLRRFYKPEIEVVKNLDNEDEVGLRLKESLVKRKTILSNSKIYQFHIRQSMDSGKSKFKHLIFITYKII